MPSLTRALAAHDGGRPFAIYGASAEKASFAVWRRVTSRNVAQLPRRSAPGYSAPVEHALNEVRDPLVGAVIDGRYRIEGLLGRGGYGCVYAARQLNVDRDVAVKVLSAEVAKSELAVRRLEREARIISQLRHPSSLKLYDFGALPDGRWYLVVERLHGLPLSEVLTPGTRLHPMRVLNLLGQLAGALAEAHSLGVVHRDVKPANIFVETLGAEELVKLLDFGIAQWAEGQMLTGEGHVIGSPLWMSPEQARGEPVDPRSDLYSLGTVAFQCLAGRPPFVADSVVAIVFKHQIEPPPALPPMQGEPHIAAALQDVVFALLAKKPDQRPVSAREVQRLAQRIRQSSGRPGDEFALSASMRVDLESTLEPLLGPPTVESYELPAGEAALTPVESSSRRGRWGLWVAGLIAAGVAGSLTARFDFGQVSPSAPAAVGVALPRLPEPLASAAAMTPAPPVSATSVPPPVAISAAPSGPAAAVNSAPPSPPTEPSAAPVRPSSPVRPALLPRPAPRPPPPEPAPTSSKVFDQLMNDLPERKSP